MGRHTHVETKHDGETVWRSCECELEGQDSMEFDVLGKVVHGAGLKPGQGVRGTGGAGGDGGVKPMSTIEALKYLRDNRGVEE